MKKNEKKKGEYIFSPAWKVLLAFVLISGVGGLSSKADDSHVQDTRLTFSVKNATVKSVLDRIEKNTGFSFMYENNVMDLNSKVDFEAENESIESVLDRLLSDEVAYRIVGKHILLFRNEKQPAEKVPAVVDVQQQQRTVTGKVTDQNGEPLPGTTVMVKGTTIGTITDADGNYSLSNVPDDATLVFSFVGMETQEINVGNRTRIDVTLQEEAVALEEVVAIGYGVQRKESVVGAISQVSGDKLKNIKVGGPVENMLQGTAPGLVVILPDATPGEGDVSYYGKEGLQINIRGMSAMGSNAPLLIVDGVERSFSNLDPNEIESISILKDASATAVYGVKGANGVIIVTTKRGRSGALELEFSANVSVKTPTILPEFLDAYETLKLRNVAAMNDQQWDQIVPEEVLQKYKDQSEPYLYRNFDWMDFYFKPGIDQSYNLNARGGTDFVRYFVSVGYLNEGDIFDTGDKVPYDYDKKNASYYHNKYTFRNNLDFSLTPSTSLTLNLGGNVREFGKPIDTFTQERWFQSVTDFPYYPPEAQEKYPDEIIPWDKNARRPFVDPNSTPPTGRLYWEGGLGFWRHKANETNIDVGLEQKLDFLTEGLSIAGLYSYNNSIVYRKEYSLPQFYAYYLDPETKLWSRYYGEGIVDYNTPPPKLRILNDNVFSNFRSHYYQARLNYNRTFSGIHNLTGLGLFSRRESQTLSDFPHYEENWVARGTYNYDMKYFLEASVSYTGSEKFAPGLRFGTFPSFACGWTVSREDFFKPFTDVVNNLKLRYSWGEVGSDAGIPRWLYRTEYTMDGGSVQFGYPLQNYPFISEGPIPVTDATWEKATLRDLGIEIGLFQNFITLTVDLFDEQRRDILQTRNRVPSWVGVSSIQGNIGKTKSHGLEIQLGVQHQFPSDLYLYFNGYYSASESRVIFWDESEFLPDHLKAEGKPVELARRMYGRGVMDNGYYEDFDELFIYPQRVDLKPMVGDLKFLDFDGNGFIDQQDGVVPDNPWEPTSTWNATIGGSYKGWSLEMSFYGISETERMIRSGGEFFLFPFTQRRNSAYTIHTDYWRPDNRNAEFPIPHMDALNQYNRYQTQFAMINGKYVRLRNLRIGYQFQALKSLGVDNIECSLNGNNLFTWKKEKWGGDPEGFNYGTDFGAYPNIKRWTLEFRVKF